LRKLKEEYKELKMDLDPNFKCTWVKMEAREENVTQLCLEI
jgi:hypothetical protein